MKKFKTFLGLVCFALIVYVVLTIIMPKIAFSQKKGLLDSYKVSKTMEDTSDTYIIRLDMGKGTWEGLEIELNRIDFKPSDPAEFWTKNPDKDDFTAKEISGFVKEYCRKTTKHLPVQEYHFTEYIAVMKDDNNEYHLYYELRMGDSEMDPLTK